MFSKDIRAKIFQSIGFSFKAFVFSENSFEQDQMQIKDVISSNTHVQVPLNDENYYLQTFFAKEI